MKSTEKAADSIVVQTAPTGDEDTDAGGQENSHDDTDVNLDSELEDHTSSARVRNQENEGGGEEETGTATGTGIAFTGIQDTPIEQTHHNGTSGLTTKVQHILDNVHQAWGTANVNMLLDAAICPSAWTERPAKQLSKLARATGVNQRAWAIGQLQQFAKGRPLTKTIIQQVYDQAVVEGKTMSGRSSKRSRAPASVPDTPPQAHKKQQQQQQEEEEEEYQTPTGPSQRRAASANPAAGRAASIELGQSPASSISRPQTEEAQGDETASDLISYCDIRSLVRFYLCLFIAAQKASRDTTLNFVPYRRPFADTFVSLANRPASSTRLYQPTQLTRLVFAPFPILTWQTNIHSQCCTRRSHCFAIR